jgi:ABC-type lipoprotein release transport system permease subunit
LTLLAVLFAVSSAVTFAGFAGARRTESVLHRFLATTRSRDTGAMIQSADVVRHPEQGITLRDTIAGINGVRDVAMARGYPMQVGTKYDFSVGSSPDGSYFHRIDAPLVLRGRLPHATSVDEVAISDSAARELHLGPGDDLHGTVYDRETVAAFVSHVDTAPVNITGHGLDLRIVGLVRTQDELQGQQNGSAPIAIASPAFDRAHRSDIGAAYTVYGVRGPARTADLWAAVNALPGAGQTSSAQVATIGDDFGNDAGTAYRAIAAATLAFSVVALLATLLTVTLATGRQISLAFEADQLGWALGLNRRQRVVALAAPPSVALFVGLVFGLAGAIAMSPLFPVSTARLAEPSPGIRFDPLVHLGGWVLLGAMVAFLTMVVAWRSLARRAVAATPKRLRWVPGVASAHVPAMVGLRHAFGTGGDRRTVPSVGARVGAVVSVAGVIAVAVLMASIHVAQNEPARFGWTWDSKPDVTDLAAVDRIRTGLQNESDVTAAAELLGDVAVVGHSPMSLRAIRDVKGSTPLSITRGRMPTGPDDVALGAQTMRDLGLHLGRQVTIVDKQGGRHSMNVVGQVVLPPVDSDGQLGTGAAVTADTFDRFIGDAASQNLVLTYRHGADSAALEHRLEKLSLSFPIYARPEAPGLILQLNRMWSLGAALMVFLAALGSVGLLHFLTASVRRRRAEFGGLRALGMVRAQVWGAVTWQALAVSAVGLVLGVPGGIIVGRTAWRAAVGRIGMIDDPAVPVLAVAAVVVIVAVGTVLLAAGPGWVATRRTPAALLRSE